MSQPLRKHHPILSPLNSTLVDLPAPQNLSIMWNFGSLLGLCLAAQIVTGLLLSMHYSPHTDLAFTSIAHITRDVNWGWSLRNLHANGASMFFFCLYLHMSRSLYYGSYVMMETWNLGVTIFIATMATAFMGYLLPWGQMSFWGATVITNLFSAFPYIGKSLVEWLWGGFGINNATLTRFFSLHFILPFLITVMAILHLIFLHSTGSNNPLGINSNSMKTPFHTQYTTKDLVGFNLVFLLLLWMSFFSPNYLSDPENFIPANPLVTPTHIKPEWYFLWAYAILRSIPNKLGGVITMFSAILILYLLPLLNNNQLSCAFNTPKQLMTWNLGVTMLLLTWIGGSPVEDPYSSIGALMTLIYFVSFMCMFIPLPMRLQYNLNLLFYNDLPSRHNAQ